MQSQRVRNVLKSRNGKVLSPDTIIKADNYLPYSHVNELLEEFPKISGAPNFRYIIPPHSNTPIYAVGQPTAFGIRAVLNFVQGHFLLLFFC
jgi:hypothetical protein